MARRLLSTKLFEQQVGIRRIYHHQQQHRFYSSPKKLPRLLDSTKLTPMIAKLQQDCWDGYVSTGRGCQTLFQLIDTNATGQISWEEIRFFLENVRESDVNPDARKDVMSAAAQDGKIDFHQFQQWLIKATKVDPSTMNTFASQHYHASIGHAMDSTLRSWNKHTMSQNLRRMQYAVRGEVVIRADASECNIDEILFIAVMYLFDTSFINDTHPYPSLSYSCTQHTSGRRGEEDYIHQHWQSTRCRTKAHYLLPSSPCIM
jgi:hypothetical protein